MDSREEVQALIREGNCWRTTEATLANAVSSRSHAVLQLRVDVLGGGGAVRRSGKLSTSPPHLPHISPTSPPHLPTSPLYLP